MFCILNIYKEHIKSANSRAKAPVLCNTPPTLALPIAIENFLPGRNSQQEWQAVKKWTSSISWNRSGQTSISESKNSSNFRFFSNISLTEFFYLPRRKIGNPKLLKLFDENRFSALLERPRKITLQRKIFRPIRNRYSMYHSCTVERAR